MKINIYRNSYFDDDSNQKSKEQYDEELRKEYEDEFEADFEDDSEEYDKREYSSYNIVQDEQGTTEELPTLKPIKKKKKKLRFMWRFLIKLLAVLMAVVIAVLIFGYAFSFFTPPVTNVLVMATDEDGTRTDTLMLVSFDKKTKEISILSIPRDTYVTVSEENYSLMRQEYPQPGSRSMKINTVHHFGGEKYGVELLKQEVCSLLDVNVDFYVKVNFEAFRYIIDSVGGIEFDVPRNMSYSDPLQNLYINLQKGTQKLNGEQAEHLLRYRSGYANADIGRISVQQDFVKAFINQTVSKGTILSHPTAYLDVMFKYKYVETDVGLFDVLSYAILIGGIETDAVKTQTLPGTPAMRGGQSVYLPNLSELKNLLKLQTKE